MKQRFGVQKIILLNSGSFQIAELDLRVPVHLAADNNSGKSTIINALQFLFVDQFDEMVFENHDPVQTRKHYFGPSPSYIIFECFTKRGPQCLVAYGSGEIAQSKFERMVHRGTFNLQHYQDENKRLVNIKQLNRNLLKADSAASEIASNHLWRVLCQPNDHHEDSGRLGILPIKREEDYRSFRNVFIRLLSLSRANAGQLKDLLVACSCQSIRAQTVDVRKRYADEFKRLEGRDLETQWLHAVAPQIERGISIRMSMAAFDDSLRAVITNLLEVKQRSIAIERLLSMAIEEGRKSANAKLSELDGRRTSTTKNIGRLEERLRTAEARLNSLEDANRAWSTVSELEFTSWKAERDRLSSRVEILQSQLVEVKHHDVNTLERQVQIKTQKVETQKSQLQDWEKRTSSYLLKQGVAIADQRTIFKLINPEIARVPHKEVFGSTPAAKMKAVVKRLLSTYSNGTFSIDGVSIEMSSIGITEDVLESNPELMIANVKAEEQALTRLCELLEVSKDQQKAADELDRERQALAAVDEKLQAYKKHQDDYSNKDAYQKDIDSLKHEIATNQAEISKVEGELSEQRELVKALDDATKDVQHSRSLREFVDKQIMESRDRLKVAVPPPGELEKTPPDAIQLKGQLHQSFAKMQRLGDEFDELLHDHEESNKELEQLQHLISRDARSRGAPWTAVFDQDTEADWREVQRLKDSMDAAEQELNDQWNAMFKILAGELQMLQQSVAEIKKRVSRINSEFRKYRVSNLKLLELIVDHDNRGYATVELLTMPDSMFLKSSELDEAKRELRNWINDGRTIDLKDLFSIRIKKQDFNAERAVEVPDLNSIGSQGTGMTVKVMIYLQLLKLIINDEEQDYRMHFYLDEVGHLDPRNLSATADMAVRRGFIPITAAPNVRAEELAHPEVQIYHLGVSGDYFSILNPLTYRIKAKKLEAASNGDGDATTFSQEAPALG